MEASSGAGEGAGRSGPFRRLYHWVLDWAHRPGGPVALFGIAGLLPLMVNPLAGRLGFAPAELRWFFPWVGLLIALSLLFLWPVEAPRMTGHRAPPTFSGAWHALRARAQVGLRLAPCREVTRRLHHVLGTWCHTVDGGGVLDGGNGHRSPLQQQLPRLGEDGPAVRAKLTIAVLQHVRHVLSVNVWIVDGDNVNAVHLGDCSADEPAQPTKAI